MGNNLLPFRIRRQHFENIVYEMQPVDDETRASIHAAVESIIDRIHTEHGFIPKVVCNRRDAFEVFNEKLIYQETVIKLHEVKDMEERKLHPDLPQPFLHGREFADLDPIFRRANGWPVQGWMEAERKRNQAAKADRTRQNAERITKAGLARKNKEDHHIKTVHEERTAAAIESFVDNSNMPQTIWYRGRHNDPNLPFEDPKQTLEICEEYYTIIDARLAPCGILIDQNTHRPVVLWNFFKRDSNLEHITDLMSEIPYIFNEIPNNGPQLGGQMYGLGHTKGYGTPLHRDYKPRRTVRPEELEEFIPKIKEIEKYIGERFRNLTSVVFRQCQDQLIEWHAPSVGQQSAKDSHSSSAFCSNFAVTMGDFHNKPHIDNDESSSGYCFWATTEGGKRVDYFVFTEYRWMFKIEEDPLEATFNPKKNAHFTLKPIHLQEEAEALAEEEEEEDKEEEEEPATQGDEDVSCSRPYRLRGGVGRSDRYAGCGQTNKRLAAAVVKAGGVGKGKHKSQYAEDTLKSMRKQKRPRGG